MTVANRHTACAVCNGEAGLIDTRRLPDGSHVCRSCQTAIPASFLEERYVTAEDARNGAAYGKEAMEILSPAFTATSQYGRIFLDERNGLFTVCDATSIGKGGKLKPHCPGSTHVLPLRRCHFPYPRFPQTSGRPYAMSGLPGIWGATTSISGKRSKSTYPAS